MKRLCYLIGVPGSGKTTLMTAVLAPFDGIEADKPLPHVSFRNGRVAWLGKQRPPFGGTDALAMNIQPKVLAWMQSPMAPDWIIGEGDRLGCQSFFRESERIGYQLQVLWLDTPLAVAAARREERRLSIGAEPQNERWVGGRVTKVERLWKYYEAVGKIADTNQHSDERYTGFLRLDGTKPVAELVHTVLQQPAFEWTKHVSEHGPVADWRSNMGQISGNVEDIR